MPTIAEVRQQYPQYSDMSDADLAGALHKKFYSDMPPEEFNQKIGLKAEAKAPDDHGLARRQAKSKTLEGFVASPVTEYWENQKELSHEALNQMKSGPGQMYDAAFNNGIWGDVPKFAAGVGNTAFGALGYVGSPISAAYRTAIGQPIEDATGVPREYTEFGAQLATPGIGLTRMPGKPGAPVNPAEFRPGPAPAALPDTGGTGPSGLDAGLAAQRLTDAGYPTDLPRSIASDSPRMQRGGEWSSNIPLIGDPLKTAVHDTVPRQLLDARNKIAGEYGAGTGPNVSKRAGDVVSEAAAAETKAATDAADRANAAALAAHEQKIADTRQTIADFEARAGERTRAGVGDVDPQDMGQALIERLTAGEQEARATKNRLYDTARQSDAVVNVDAVKNVRQHVNEVVDRAGVRVNPGIPGVDPGTTPAARSMLEALDEYAALRTPGNMVRPGAAPAPRPGPAPGAPQAAPAAAQPGHSLTEFLASRGGLGPDAELSAIAADRHVVDVGGMGKRRLVKQGGDTLDYAREAAEEAGYLPKGSTPNDMLDMIEAEMRGNKRYPEGAAGGTTSREAAAQGERARAEQSAFRRGLENDLTEAGHGGLKPEVRARVIKEMERGTDADTAVERVLRQLDNAEPVTPRSDFPGDRPTARTTEPGSPQSIQGIEDVRVQLGRLAERALTPSDKRAAANIKRAFDDWESNAIDKELFSGSPEGLAAVRKARAANRDLMERFGYNADPGVEGVADRILNRIATGDVKTEDVANWLLGSSKIGASGSATRLVSRIRKATNDNPEAMQAIQGGVWNKLSQAKPEEIDAFLGRSLAKELYTPEQQDLIRAYADTRRRATVASKLTDEVAKTTKPGTVTPEKGPMQQLADRVIGGKQGKDEALWQTIENLTKKRGDVKALAEFTRALPQEMKGDIPAAVIRGLGTNAAGDFTLDQFVRQWNAITPQAKAVLFGNAGEKVKALDDIKMVAERMRNISARYGNKSGTAQNTNLTHMLQTLFTSLTAVAAGTGGILPAIGTAGLMGGTVGAGYLGARILAKPATAASLAKHLQAVERAQQSPTAMNQALVGITQRNLINTVKTIGATRSLPQSPRLLQGPVPAGAQNEQR